MSIEDPVAFLWGCQGQTFVNRYIQCQPAPLNRLAEPFSHLFDAPTQVNEFYQSLVSLGLQHGGVILPDFYEQGAAAGFSAIAACQRGSHFNHEGWPRLIPEGLRTQGHLAAALALEAHPFQMAFDLPADLDFAVLSAASESQTCHRRAQIRHWRRKAKHLQPLSELCLRAMSPRVRAVAAKTNIAMWLYFCIASAWADVTLPGRLLSGFAVVGRVEDAPIFRPVSAAPKPACPQALLESAKAYTDDLLRQLRRPSRDPAADRALLALCQKDLDRGGASGFLTKEAVDSKYGPGNWRALPRFPIKQGDKWRGIDDGKRSGRVHTTSHDLVLALARRFHAVLHKDRCAACRA